MSISCHTSPILRLVGFTSKHGSRSALHAQKDRSKRSRLLPSGIETHHTGNSIWQTYHSRSCHSVKAKSKPHLSVENGELLTGDCLLLVAFCIYKQITAIILHPSFPGWLEPLHFNPARFAELASFSSTVTVSWVLSSLLVGGYKSTASADLRTALTKVSEVWLISMPVAACQLVLLTAAMDKTFVGSDLFASYLPLAATGPGEPGATAAGILGIMSIWRCFYSAFLDVLNSGRWSYLEARIDRLKDMNFFVESLRTVFLLAIACTIIMQYLSKYVGEEHLQGILSSREQSHLEKKIKNFMTNQSIAKRMTTAADRQLMQMSDATLDGNGYVTLVF